MLNDIDRKKPVKGAERVRQDEHMDEALSKKCVTGILIPGTLITDNITTAPRLVGKGNVCRIRITAGNAPAYIAFGDDPTAAPLNAPITSATDPGLELFSAGTYLVVSRGDFIRSSSVATRFEVLPG